MKKLFFVLACFIILNSTKAQQEAPIFKSSVAVKWNPESLYFGKVSLSGEYNFKNRKSVTFGIGIPASHSTTVNMDDKDRSVEMKTFSVMGGYRMYLGKKTMSGIYFEPYLKYVKNDANTVIDGDLDGRTVNFVTTSKYSGTGVGAQLGVQFMIAKRVVFDFFFLGPEANTVNHKIIMHDTSLEPWTQAEADDAQRTIDDNIGDLPIVGDKLKVVVDRNNKTVSSDYSGFLPGIRFGLSVGIRL
ncbi:MAG: outer membrane beta-barrel protein [Flavisolibacter sp.]